MPTNNESTTQTIRRVLATYGQGNIATAEMRDGQLTHRVKLGRQTAFVRPSGMTRGPGRRG